MRVYAYFRLKLPVNISLLLRIYLISLIIFLGFRIILFVGNIEKSYGDRLYNIFYAFIIGLRFDIVICSYLLILPFLLVTINYFFVQNKIMRKNIFRFVQYYIIVVFIISFFISSADIPYFNQFNSRLNASAFLWIKNYFFVTKMIVEEPRYWLMVFPLIIASSWFIFSVKRYFRPIILSDEPFNLNWKNITISVVFLGLMFLGARGRIEHKSPIKTGTAYFCNNPFLNQLGLNPNFTLVKSYLKSLKEKHGVMLIDNQLAIHNIKKYLKVDTITPSGYFEKVVKYDSMGAHQYNVVLIIMESMSASKMRRHGNPENLTPFLDSLSYCGYYFENAYTTGIHTFNGIFSTLFSMPAYFREHPMDVFPIPKLSGIFSTLKDFGYSTIYFTTHDGQFDNVAGFLKANDCEKIVSVSDYPSNKIKTTLGVPDDYMFEFSIPLLNNLYQKNKPFAAVFMTASDHGPYYIPDYFKPKSKEIKKQSVEYADYALRKFISLSIRQPWFKRTIFVFVADHGAAMDNIYEMPLSYHHSPLLFYAPEIIHSPKSFDVIASQMDVYPSIMGLLKLPYVNKTFGIDLFNEKREYAILSADDKYGAIGKHWFLMIKTDGTKKLYNYKTNELKNYAEIYPDTLKAMEEYVYSHLQVYQCIRNNQKTLY